MSFFIYFNGIVYQLATFFTELLFPRYKIAVRMDGQQLTNDKGEVTRFDNFTYHFW